MKDLLDIREFIREKKDSEPLVLCTLVSKRGSSYRGVGAKKVVALSGLSVGLLSGGCLEASIVKTACERFSEMPFTLTFDMLSDDDRLLGYQTGCQGAIDILFEKIDPAVAPEKLIAVNPVELCIIGCGADAGPYAALARPMGWTVRYIDYRRDLCERFGVSAIHCKLGEIASHIPSSPNCAAVLMTHNYESDLEIMRGLSGHKLGYLGCLGPAGRFAKMREDLLKFHGLELNPELLNRTFAPVGIFSHSRSPEEIALSVVAQIQDELVERRQRKVWTLILAAGASSRFGSPKALASVEDGTFLSRALSTAAAFSGENVLVVTGAHRELLTPHLGEVKHVFNELWQDGMSTSLRAGFQRIEDLDPGVEGVVVLPVDQPYVSDDHLQSLARNGLQLGRCALTSMGADSGPPAFIPRRFFSVIKEIRGDRGIKSSLTPGQMLSLDNPAAFRDVDQ